MKICEVTEKNLDLFSMYIPSRYAGAVNMKNDHRVFGLYEGEGDDVRAVSAAVVYVYDGTAEILSLSYNDDMEEGKVEQEITDFILRQKWDIYRILYVTSGDEEVLGHYDYVMLDIGYAPSTGDVMRYHTTLQDIIKLQGENIERYKERKNKETYLKGKELTAKQLDHYNRLFPLTRYEKRPETEELSCFMIKDDLPEAGIEVISTGDNTLEFAWMNTGSSSRTELMDMLFYLISEASDAYDTSAEVVICPYQREVAQLVERFGFVPDPTGGRTRIYNYYI